ncbi:transketolase C-terminal domain-containing protein [Melioribacter sp. Ez-97]|uniref:transketolase C-terminal domain-containing protein n=1 Tax=Melioribacter sp. Ez-97 TaxID=3423434 RepID=UPI003EDB0D9A
MPYNIIKKEEFDKVRFHEGNWEIRMRLYAEMCRYNTLVAVKKAGSGHLGSSFSSLDIVTYLYLNELNVLNVGLDDENRDIYFSSKGHDVPGLYSFLHSVGILPEEKLLKLRRLNGLDGHPEVRIPGIEASTGSLGMGISKGKGMAWAKKYKKRAGIVYVLTGDGEFQEGQIWESLQAAAHQRIDNLIAVMDHNKYQTDMLVSEVNNIEDVTAKVKSFGWHAIRINGHDFNQLKRAFGEIKEVKDKPKMIIADTVKGKGVSFMEKPVTETVSGKTYYKWHSGAPDNDSYVKGLNELSDSIKKLSASLNIEIVIPENAPEEKISFKSSKEFVTDAFGDALVELAKENPNIIVLDGDLAADCKLRKFEYTYPDRFIENGIAEQDMVSTAGGLARMGLIPVVNSFASFLAARANEQIYNNAGEKTKIIYVCHFAGIIPAGPGKSHQSIRDIALLGNLPNITIIQPCNAFETKKAVEYCVNEAKENCALRLVIGPSPRKIVLPENYQFRIGIGAELTEGEDAIIFAYGPVMLHEALTASEILKKSGFGLKVVNMPWLNKIDLDWIAEITDEYKKIYVLEDHSTTGGLGDRILDALAAVHHFKGKLFEKIGLNDYPECGAPDEVLKYHGLDGLSLAERISGYGNLTEKQGENFYSAEAPQ